MGKRKPLSDGSKRRCLKVNEIPQVLKGNFPDPPHPTLPKHPFTLGFIAPKGSGKTTTLVNFVVFYANFFHNIFVFSPTIKSDDKWLWVRQQDLLCENTTLKRFVDRLNNDPDDPRSIVAKPPPAAYGREAEETREMWAEEPKFNGRVPEECFLDDYDQSTLRALMDQQQSVTDYLEGYKTQLPMAPRFLINRVLFIFDDLVGSQLFSLAHNNPFKKLNTNHRHYSASILMVSQAYKEIPRAVRTNWSALILFCIPNQQEVEVIYAENPVFLAKPCWMEMFRYATEEPFSFLYINYQTVKRDERCMKNFDEILSFRTSLLEPQCPADDPH